MRNSIRILPYLQLTRIPNVFTAMADVLMGASFAQTMSRPWPMLSLLVAASSCLYTAGMVLNDVYDLEIDRSERPQRPLPSGSVDVKLARRLGFGLLGLGIGLAFLYGRTSGFIALTLATVVWCYDAYAKATWLGPLAMGGCRFLNVVMGMSCLAIPPDRWLSLDLPEDQWLVAAGIGVYVMGITIFAKAEAEISPRSGLIWGGMVMMVGVILLACFPEQSQRPLQIRNDASWFVLLGMLMITVLRRCVRAIVLPSARLVQQAIKTSIFSLVVLDAAVVLATQGPWHALGILALLVPMLVLGKWVYST